MRLYWRAAWYDGNSYYEWFNLYALIKLSIMYKTVTVLLSLGLISILQTLQAYFLLFTSELLLILSLFHFHFLSDFRSVSHFHVEHCHFHASFARSLLILHLLYLILKKIPFMIRSFIIHMYLFSSVWYEFWIDFNYAIVSFLMQKQRIFVMGMTMASDRKSEQRSFKSYDSYFRYWVCLLI